MPRAPVEKTQGPRRPAHDFSQLYRRYREQVIGQLRFLVPEADVEDVAQVVFLEVFRSLDSFAGRSALSTWIHAVTTRQAIKSRRGHMRRRLELVTDDEDQLPDPEDPTPRADEVLEGQDLIAHVAVQLRRLSDKHRHVLEFFYFDDLDVNAIAVELNVPMGTVLSRLHGARRSFELLETTGEPHVKRQAPPTQSVQPPAANPPVTKFRPPRAAGPGPSAQELAVRARVLELQRRARS